MHSPLVSIIVITYNQEAYVEAAVLSCLAQSFRNIEVIVSDDASCDATVEIVKWLARGDSRIRLLTSNANRGVTGNVQNALTHCTGKYIAFLGGDDILFPEKIATQVAIMEGDSELALTFSQCHVIYGTDLTPIRITGDTGISDVSDGYELAKNFGVEIPGPAPMVRRSMVPVGGFRDIAPVASDWLFFIETSYLRKCKLIKVPLAAYRMHGNNVGKRRYEYVQDYVRSYEFVRANYGGDTRLVQCAKTALRRYLLGTFYASVLEQRTATSVDISKQYRSMFGFWSMFILLVPATHLRISGLFSLLKPLLKRMV